MSPDEKRVFGHPSSEKPRAQSADNIRLGDEINVVIRGRIIEKGSQLVTIDLMELHQQNRVDVPILIHMPIQEIRSSVSAPPSDIHPAVPDKPDIPLTPPQAS